jgi:hypothetical protein
VKADWQGYHKNRIFVGTALQWCEQGGYDPTWCTNYLGSSINDKLVMKWNAEWDRGNDEKWVKPPYNAWEDNEWNGMFPGGSGYVWHYKIVWVPPCGDDGTPLGNGGYCLWGQFEVLMDQGTGPDGHMVVALAAPNGYGSYGSHP